MENQSKALQTRCKIEWIKPKIPWSWIASSFSINNGVEISNSRLSIERSGVKGDEISQSFRFCVKSNLITRDIFVCFGNGMEDWHRSFHLGKRQTEFTKTKICIGKWKKKLIGNEKDSPLRHSSCNHKTNSIEAAFYVLLPQSADWKVSWSEKVNIIHPNQNWMIDFPFLSPATFFPIFQGRKKVRIIKLVLHLDKIVILQKILSGPASVSYDWCLSIADQNPDLKEPFISFVFFRQNWNMNAKSSFTRRSDQKPFGFHAV